MGLENPKITKKKFCEVTFSGKMGLKGPKMAFLALFDRPSPQKGGGGEFFGICQKLPKHVYFDIGYREWGQKMFFGPFLLMGPAPGVPKPPLKGRWLKVVRYQKFFF